MDSLVLKCMISPPSPKYQLSDYGKNIQFVKIYYGGKHVRDAPYLIMEHPIHKTNIYLIYFHAKDEDIYYASEFISEIQEFCKFNAIVVEYPSYGIYKANNVTDKMLEQDAIQIFDHIQEKYQLKNSQIIVFGRSIGTALAFYINSLRECRGVIALSPFTSIQAIVEEKTFKFLSNLISPKFDNLLLCKLCKSPMLLIHGDVDELISKSHTIDLFNSLPEQVKSQSIKVIRPDMTHNDYVLEHDIVYPIQMFFPELAINRGFLY